MSDPKISIITVVFNGGAYLKRAIDSVAALEYGNLEYIIIDGGSNDSTLAIIEECKDIIDYWVSESDKGIYDAMNKGIRAANGDFLLYLNADDFFVGPHVLSDAMAVLKRGGDGYCGAVNMVDKSGKVLYSMRTVEGDPFSYLMHQGFLYNKKLHNLAGEYNTNYKVNSDYDFYLRLLDKGVELAYGDLLICNMQVGGVSGTMGYLSAAESLYIQIRYELPLRKAVRIFHYKLMKIFIKSFLVSVRMDFLVKLFKKKR